MKFFTTSPNCDLTVRSSFATNPGNRTTGNPTIFTGNLSWDLIGEMAWGKTVVEGPTDFVMLKSIIKVFLKGRDFV